VYNQLKGLRGDLDKVKQINRQIIQTDTESEDDDESDYDSESGESPSPDRESPDGMSKLEKRY
jgi:hypothetical protein